MNRGQQIRFWSKNLDLLWKAWPDGYLPMRGVLTMGAWQCRWTTMAGRFAEFILDTGLPLPPKTEGLGEIRRILVENGCAARGDDGELARGDLLPRPDPFDTATWGCMLLDLARAAGLEGYDYNALDTLRWVRITGHTKFHPQYWLLRNETWEWRAPDEISPITDPGEALVRARIHLRNTP